MQMSLQPPLLILQKSWTAKNSEENYDFQFSETNAQALFTGNFNIEAFLLSPISEM